MKEDKKINLIYIASSGHSGSTLLELLLHNLKGLWSMGEISAISWEFKEPHQKCSCGEDVSQCPFWKEVRNKAGNLLESDFTHPFREEYGSRRLIRSEMLEAGKKITNSPNHNKFCEENYSLFKAIAETAEKESGEEVEYLVDSSKGPYRLWWFKNCPGFEVKTLHITKDPRAFVYSMTKRLSGWKRFWISMRMSLRYVVENNLIRRVSGSNYKHIKYEDLASNPEKTIKEISEWLGVPCEYLKNKKANHGVSGNTMRYNFNEVKLDEKWKKKLNSVVKFITRIITYFSAKKYGYFK